MLIKKDKLYSILLVLLILFLSNFNIGGSVLLFLISMISCFYIIHINYLLNKYSLIAISIIICSFFLTLNTNPINSLFYLLAELKIILLFFTFYFGLFLQKKVCNYESILLNTSKILITLSFIVPLYGLLILHVYRYSSFLGLSIYMAYNIILLFYFFYAKYSLKWKMLIFISLLLLGSRTALILYFIVVFFQQKNIKFKIFTIIISILFLVYYLLIFRGMENQSFENINRVLLIEATYSYMINHFELVNYLFGYGIGKELKGYQTLNEAFNSWFLGDFTKYHVFSYAFHNEVFRLLYDFGLIFLIFLYAFFKQYHFPIIVLLFMMLTNSVFFANGTILIIGLLIAYTKNQQRDVNNERHYSFNTYI